MSGSLTRRVAQNAFWLFGGSALAKLFDFVLVIYLARTLTAAGFGLLSVAQAVLLYLLLIIDSGTALQGAKEIARRPADVSLVSSNLLALRLLLALIVFILASAGLSWLPLAADLKSLLLISFLLVFAKALTVDWVFQGLEQMGYVALFRVVQQLLSFGLILLFIKSASALLLVPGLQLAGAMISALLLLLIMFWRFAPFSLAILQPRLWRTYLAAALPLGASAIFMQIYYNLDVIMLCIMQRPEIVGWYSAAYKVFFLFLGTMGVLSAAVFPIVCHKFAQDRAGAVSFLNKYAHLLLLVFIPIVVLGMICAEPAMRLLFGGQYAAGSLALKILLLNILIITGSGIYGSLVLVPTGRNKAFMISVGLGAVCNIALNLWLIPAFSLNGAAGATLVTELIVLGAFYYWARRELSIDWLSLVYRPGVAALLAVLVVQISAALVPASSWRYLLVTAPVFSATYLLVLGLTGEQKFIWGFISELMVVGKLK